MREPILRIGPAGNSQRFYDDGYRHTYEEGAWLYGLGLNAFEYSFGHGVSVSEPTARKIGEEMQKYDVEVSAHAPYYTNFANPDSEMVEKSFGYLLKSCQAVLWMGGRRVVFHPAAVGKASRAEAVGQARKNIVRLAALIEEAYGDACIVCPETMGKHNQIGTVEEIIDFCKLGKAFYPCYDFGHINSYLGGGLKSKDDYRCIIDKTFEELGEEKTKNMHIHFSHIQYGHAGEIRHLTFEDTVYGPEYAPLAQLIDEYKMTPFIVCESSGTMADDAVLMKKCHQRFY